MSAETVSATGDGSQTVEERLTALEEENEKLREELSAKVDINGYRYIMNSLAEILGDAEVNDYTSDPLDRLGSFRSLREEVDGLQSTVEDHQTTLDKFGEGKSGGKEEAWYATVKAAQNLAGSTPDNTVTGKDTEYDAVMYARNIVQATGYSKRYALDLIEEWGEEKQGTTWFPYKAATSGNKNNATRKRLLIDLDVWGDQE